MKEYNTFTGHEVTGDELFRELRKCHHKAVELNGVQELIMVAHLLRHCVILKRDEVKDE